MWQDRRATIESYLTLGGGSRFGVYDITAEIGAGGVAVACRRPRFASEAAPAHATGLALTKLSADEIAAFNEAYPLSGEFIKRWVQAGGKIMGGTDDPFPGATGFNQHMEMAMLVEVGLTPMQALKAMTIWARR